MVKLSDICKDLELDPSKARKILRESGVDKPGKSWSWDKKPIKVVNILLKYKNNPEQADSEEGNHLN
jgi:hypothetical protein